MEYTQEQIDELISNARKGMFTEEELNRRVTSEVDRRVESGIKKGLETQRQKWEEEFEKKSKLTAEELAQEKLKEQTASLEKRERELAIKSNLIDAKDMLTNANIPKSQYEKFIDVLVSSDAKATKSNVDNFVSMFNDTKKEIETSVRSELSKVPTPPTGNSDKTITLSDFSKMGYAEKVKFKAEHPEQYNEFIK